MQNFYERNIPSQRVFIKITDMADWKKKYRVDKRTKVFIVKGKKFPDVREALISRGWVENEDKKSCCFDLKWTVKIVDVEATILQEYQQVNHFPKTPLITSKVGLTHSLRNLFWFRNVDINTFYPRCFDLTVNQEHHDFCQEFKTIRAQSLLKIYVREMRTSFENKQD